MKMEAKNFKNLNLIGSSEYTIEKSNKMEVVKLPNLI